MSRVQRINAAPPASWIIATTIVLGLDAALLALLRERNSRIALSSGLLFIVLILTTFLLIENAIKSRRSIRVFWSFLSAGSALWAINAAMAILFAAGKSFSDPVFSASTMFLHTVMMLAAVASRPHVKQLRQRPYGITLNFFLLLFFWTFVYLFFVVPAEYLNWDGAAVRWFSYVYCGENAVLAAVTAVFLFHTKAAWKSLYKLLFFAVSIYAVGSVTANLEVARKAYFPSLPDFLCLSAACSLAWVGWRGRVAGRALPETQQPTAESHFDIPAVLAVTAIPLFTGLEILRSNNSGRINTTRLFAVLTTGILLTLTVLFKEYFVHRGFLEEIGGARDQLQLAMQCGKSIAWDLDFASGEGVWFGDLERFFGIEATTYAGRAEEFSRSLHQDDRENLLQAVVEAAKERRPFAAVFRMFLPDGKSMWVNSHAKFYSGRRWAWRLRMRGVATDVTEQKQAEAALQENEDKLRLVLESAAEGIYGVDLEGRCEFCNSAALKMLGYRSLSDVMGRKIHDQIHYSRVDGTPYLVYECPVTASIHGEERHRDTEVFWKADGTAFPVEYWAHPQKKGSESVGAVVTFIDITERRQAEEALRESEQRFRNVANRAPVMIWMCGTDKLCNYFNQPWLDFTGRPLEDELGNGWTDGVHPDDLEACINTYMGSFDARQSFTVEYRLKRHDGEYRWMLDTGVPRFTSSGEFEGYIGSAIDVTETRRAEKEAALAKERLELALETGRAGVWDLEIQTGKNVQFGDPQVLFGTSAATLQDLWASMHPEDKAHIHRSLQTAKWNKTTFLEEFRVFWPDRSVRWLCLQGKFLYDANGIPEHMLCILMDISQRKRAEEALQKSEQEFSLAFEAARLGWWVWNEETDRVMSSDATRSVLGLTAGSEMTLHDFLLSVHPEDRDRVYQTWRRSRQEGGHFFVEYRIVSADGALRWVESRGRTYKGSRGSWVQIVGVSMDVTERKKAEEELRTLGGRLIEAQEQERMRIARELHDDICQRMAIVEIELEKLNDELVIERPQLRETVKQLIGLTEETARDVQALSHELHSSKLDVLGLTSAMKSFCSEFSKQHHVEIEFTAGDIPHPMSRDVSLCLYRVLQESLHNAVKHSGTAHYMVELQEARGSVELRVKDFGRGFDPDAGLSRHGLGLVSMRERVHLVKGTIAIESLPLWGTAICARVPIPEMGASRCA